MFLIVFFAVVKLQAAALMQQMGFVEPRQLPVEQLNECVGRDIPQECISWQESGEFMLFLIRQFEEFESFFSTQNQVKK